MAGTPQQKKTDQWKEKQAKWRTQSFFSWTPTTQQVLASASSTNIFVSSVALSLSLSSSVFLFSLSIYIFFFYICIDIYIYIHTYIYIWWLPWKFQRDSCAGPVMKSAWKWVTPPTQYFGKPSAFSAKNWIACTFIGWKLAGGKTVMIATCQNVYTCSAYG